MFWKLSDSWQLLLSEIPGRTRLNVVYNPTLQQLQPTNQRECWERKPNAAISLYFAWSDLGPGSDHHIVSRPTRPANMEIALKK